MKSKYLISAALSGLFGLLVAFSANAQRHGGGGGGFHGGGGGGFHGGGGGGFHGGGGFQRGGGSFNRGGGPSMHYNAPRTMSVGPGMRGGFGGQRYGVSPGYNGRVGVAPGFRGSVGIRGNFGYRGGYGYGYRYRPYVYGGRTYYRPYNPFYRYNYFRSYYYPRLGFHLSILPYGYYPFWWGGYQYFYSDGFYYQYDNDQYTVVEPPLGAILDRLPAGAKSLMIDGEQYYELNGVYYQAVTKDDGSTGYQVAGKDGELTTGASDNGQYDNNGQYVPDNNNSADQYNQQQPQTAVGQDAQGPLQIGDIVDSLPPKTSKVKINGQTYHLSADGYYFQEDRDANNRKVYRVAGTANQGLQQ